MVDNTYKDTDAARTYIIEDMHLTVRPDLPFQFGAYWQDRSDRFTEKSDRTLGYSNNLGELVIYVGLHYPGAKLKAVWPPGTTDGSEFSRDILAAALPEQYAQTE